jgi:hypothetical protein
MDTTTDTLHIQTLTTTSWTQGGERYTDITCDACVGSEIEGCPDSGTVVTAETTKTPSGGWDVCDHCGKCVGDEANHSIFTRQPEGIEEYRAS